MVTLAVVIVVVVAAVVVAAGVAGVVVAVVVVVVVGVAALCHLLPWIINNTGMDVPKCPTFNCNLTYTTLTFHG